jgi:ribosomal protein L11 methylase PrmA
VNASFHPPFRWTDSTQIWRKFRVSGQLAEADLLLPSTDVAPSSVPIDHAHYVVEHPVVPFVSYPYEWSFAAHRRAALHHLDLHLAALDDGFTLSDASAYNVQFIGTKPVFIDHLSLIPYSEGMVWEGHRQFCAQFLNPLLFWSKLGIAPNAWFRGALEGISAEELAPLLSLKHKLSWTVLTHVVAQAALSQRRLAKGTTGTVRRPHVSKNALLGILTGLRNYIARLRPPSGDTVWADYAGNTSYNEAEAAAKRELVEEMVRSTTPKLVFDLGCNTGDYSQAALDAGAGNVIGFDFDHGALDRAYARFDGSGQSFLPLWMDASNPSPSQGWSQRERKGLQERGPANAMIALALVHHLAIGRNVPLPQVVDWLINLAPVGIIEFPEKSDPMVARLLANRTDIFWDYTEAAFLAAVQSRARIEKTIRMSQNGRLLVLYDAR